MRELVVAVALSVIVLAGMMLLPYPVDIAPATQTTVVTQPVPPAVPHPSPTAKGPTKDQKPPPEHQHVQVVQALAGASGDIAHGRQVYRKCQVCHSLEPGKNGLGPSLAGIMGKKAASVPNYNYSEALRASNLTWDAATLDRYLQDPQKLVPGNKMPFPGMRTENERRDVIAYLAAAAAPAGTVRRQRPLRPQPLRRSGGPAAARLRQLHSRRSLHLALGHCRGPHGVHRRRRSNRCARSTRFCRRRKARWFRSR